MLSNCKARWGLSWFKCLLEVIAVLKHYVKLIFLQIYFTAVTKVRAREIVQDRASRHLPCSQSTQEQLLHSEYDSQEPPGVITEHSYDETLYTAECNHKIFFKCDILY